MSKKSNVTVSEEDGVNYREIAQVLSDMGFEMNHSSVHNHVVKIMKKFAHAIAEEFDADFEEKKLTAISKSPNFQHCLAEMLHVIEQERIFNQR